MVNRLGLIVLCATLAAPAMASEFDTGKSNFIGGHVEIGESVDGSVRAVGGLVTLNAPVGGSARLVGGKVELGSEAAVADNASLAGGQITVNGSVKGDLRAAGGHVTINGSVGGDASVAAGSLTLGPNARIGGKLHFRGANLERDAGAQVAGGVEHVSRYKRDREHTPFAHSRGGWIWTAGLMVLAAIIAGALPGPSGRLAKELRERPWMAPLFGLMALVFIPIAAVLIMITIIGIPIGLLALLGYVALLIVGYVCASVVAGGLLLERLKPEVATQPAWRAGAAVVTMLAIAILARIPIVGGFVVFIALIVGVGLIVAATIHRSQQQPPPAPAMAA